MSDLLAKMQQSLHSVERSLDNFKKIGKNNYTPAKIRSRMAALKETWTQCIQHHTALLQTTTEATRSTIDYFKLNHFDQGEDIYQATLDHMAECLECLEPPVSPFPHQNPEPRRDSNSAAFSLKHLTSIKLPPFSGNFDEWESFRDRFVSLIVNNPDLSAFTRMHFLSSSLTGRALEAIKNIPITADNFEIAWRTLTTRYENKRRLIEGHVSVLFNLKQVHRESASELTDLRDQANRAIASLKRLDRSAEEILNDILVYCISQKLDQATRKAWRLKTGDNPVIPSYEELDRFLTTRARALEELTAFGSLRNTKCTSASTSTASTNMCRLCQASHFVNRCPQFIRKNPSQRREVVSQAARCMNCLSSKHATKSCASKHSCRTCHQRHHMMLHLDSESPSNTESSVSLYISAFYSNAKLAPRAPVLLATARITVSSPTGRSLTVRALLDSGSEITFATERLRQLLKLRRTRMPVTISAIGCAEIGTCQYAVDIRISPPRKSHPILATTASIMKSLTRYTPARVSTITEWDHLADLTLAGPDPFSSDQIDLLIGSDVYSEVILAGMRKDPRGQPIAQNTVFGWVLSGPTSAVPSSSRSISVQHCCDSSSLDQELRRFWEVEEVPQRTLLSPDELQCEEHFLATHSRQSDGRYVVRLPFKTGPPIEIGLSRNKAVRVLNSLLRRFNTNPTMKAEYGEFLYEYETLGHMRLAPTTETPLPCLVYIPHLPVIRDSSATTRLRVVFNASSRTSNGTSLNEHLLVGAKLQTDLSAVILRWQQYRYVYTADITKMYRQILVDQRDVDYQRILWQENDSDSLREYQLLTVTYGTVSAPFQALRVIRQLAPDDGNSFPLAVSVLNHNMFG